MIKVNKHMCLTFFFICVDPQKMPAFAKMASFLRVRVGYKLWWMWQWRSATIFASHGDCTSAVSKIRGCDMIRVCCLHTRPFLAYVTFRSASAAKSKSKRYGFGNFLSLHLCGLLISLLAGGIVHKESLLKFKPNGSFLDCNHVGLLLSHCALAVSGPVAFSTAISTLTFGLQLS